MAVRCAFVPSRDWPLVVAEPIRQLHVEAEEHHVTVRHDVLLALGARDAFLAGALPAAVGDEVRVRDRLGPNEPALEVGVNHARGDGSGIAAVDSPGANLRLAGGEVRLEPEQMITGTNEPIEPRRLDA